MSPADHRLPERVGRFDVERVLEERDGRVAVLARDGLLGRMVELHAKVAGASDSLVRTRRDTQGVALARARHPVLPVLLDAGDDDDLGPFLVVEHTGGTTLADRFAREPLSPEEMRPLLAAVANGLDTLHAAGGVHGSVDGDSIHLAHVPKLGAKSWLGYGTRAADRAAFAALVKRYGALELDPSGSAPLAQRLAEVSPPTSRISLPPAAASRRSLPGSAPSTGSSAPPDLPPASIVLRQRTNRTQNILVTCALALIVGLLVFGKKRQEGDLSFREGREAFLAIAGPPPPPGVGTAVSAVASATKTPRAPTRLVVVPTAPPATDDAPDADVAPEPDAAAKPARDAAAPGDDTAP